VGSRSSSLQTGGAWRLMVNAAAGPVSTATGPAAFAW
jgi:hypothetical protein